MLIYNLVIFLIEVQPIQKNIINLVESANAAFIGNGH